MKEKSVLGIDLGTSSVKILQRYEDGTIIKRKASYETKDPRGWWKAVKGALAGADLKSVEAIGLSSQVGTYIVDETQVIHWNCGIGEKELNRLREMYPSEEFVKEISMPHPQIISYPLPRLLYIQERYPQAKKVCQPKDLICEKLTGNLVTDPYSWRGLANLKTKKYSEKFLNSIGFSKEKLPQIIGEKELAGYTRKTDLGGTILPEGIPVYTGLNDFFSALLGMGVEKQGDVFDISGTSEHLGILEEGINLHTKMVSGPYLNHYVHYGVTASSGASLDFGQNLWATEKLDLEKMTMAQPPIFLPYLNGERAPVWDPQARGMFFGIGAGCTREELAYGVLEGVVFSLYHIYESMGKPEVTRFKIVGGAAVNPILNQLKAEMFHLPAEILEEVDSSAMGAVIIASVGAGWFSDYKKAAENICRIREVAEPSGKYEEWFQDRFSIYKELYPAVKNQYKQLRRIRQ